MKEKEERTRYEVEERGGKEEEGSMFVMVCIHHANWK